MSAIGRVWNNDPTSAGLCHGCGIFVDRRYGGQGSAFAYCLDCWNDPSTHESADCRYCDVGEED